MNFSPDGLAHDQSIVPGLGVVNQSQHGEWNGDEADQEITESQGDDVEVPCSVCHPVPDHDPANAKVGPEAT